MFEPVFEDVFLVEREKYCGFVGLLDENAKALEQYWRDLVWWDSLQATYDVFL